MDIDDDVVIHPVRFKKERPIPDTGLLLVNPSEASYGLDTSLAAGCGKRYMYHTNLSVHEEKGYFVAGPAIGAPLSVMTMEKLIALGARKIILFGWCGSLHQSLAIGELLLPTRAVSGEGTSAYYVTGDQPASSPSLVQTLRGLLKRNTLAWHEGGVWSTDAPYRERRSVLSMLHEQQGVCAVDMEYTALCSAAAFRRIDFAALLLVSDEVWGASWNPGFSRDDFKSRSRALIDLLLNELPLKN
ncbi:MAG: nucleoside phosphorylase [Desulfocapsaceae bacterium]|nr:nucleoside phosphorylase [Desulfocapsaceae bacterium]